jgi:CDGSH-type Zn-finger protein
VLTRPDVFVPNVEGEWLHPDATSAEAVARVAHACPSGAIQYERFDGGENEAPPVVNLLHVRENGPLAVHAQMRIGESDVGFRATLCRCGASKHKPFCDSSHVAEAFKATGEPPSKESRPLEQRAGTLAITPLKDGPLRLEGNVELVSGTGRTLDRTTKAFLCRCGHSGDKPYCDGSHRTVGFKSE